MQANQALSTLANHVFMDFVYKHSHSGTCLGHLGPVNGNYYAAAYSLWDAFDLESKIYEKNLLPGKILLLKIL